MSPHPRAPWGRARVKVLASHLGQRVGKKPGRVRVLWGRGGEGGVPARAPVSSGAARRGDPEEKELERVTQRGAGDAAPRALPRRAWREPLADKLDEPFNAGRREPWDARNPVEIFVK